MKNILQENMRRFRTKNLTEQTNAPITWKELQRAGYEQVGGSMPYSKSDTFYHDATLVALGSTITAADMALQAALRTKRIFNWSQSGAIVHKTTPEGKIEAKYISKTPIA